MGTVYAELTLRNSEDIALANQGFLKSENIRTVTVTAIVDTGAFSLVIDETTMQKLGLGTVGVKQVRIANGEQITCPVTTPVEINWKDRQSVMRVTAVPGLPQVLLGVLPLEEMDLVVHPKLNELVGAHGEEMEFMVF